MAWPDATLRCRRAGIMRKSLSGGDKIMSLGKTIARWFAPGGMREHSVQCVGPHGLHRMHYVEWGEPDNPRMLVCVHGLSRNCRDFDFLAQAMAGEYRVICPDVVGRGDSAWLPVSDDYGFPLYVADMVTLIARLDVESVDWVGTSMGGLIGMLLAAQPGNPIHRLVLNDVGPVVTGVSLQRIGQYLGNAPPFPDLQVAEQYIRAVSATFGPLTDAQWRHLTVHSLKRGADGQYRMSYDPDIAAPFRKITNFVDTDLWGMYDLIKCPVLLVRGAQSDLLTADTAQQMTTRGPKARLVEFAGVGHAPVLMDEAQIGAVRDFLLAA
jgi:pimeloyl-ACP methyl ester carboxylesterase